MADGQPSALGGGRHPGTNTPVGLSESKNCMCDAATCDPSPIMMSCPHFGERSSEDDVAEMKDRSVQWLRLSAVANTT